MESFWPFPDEQSKLAWMQPPLESPEGVFCATAWLERTGTDEERKSAIEYMLPYCVNQLHTHGLRLDTCEDYDLDKIKTIYAKIAPVQMWSIKLFDEWFNNYYNKNNGWIFVVRDDDKIAGFVCGSRNKIIWVATDKEYQAKGVGHALLIAACVHLITMGFSSVSGVTSNTDHPRAFNMYIKLGCKIKMVTTGYHKDCLDKIIAA